MVTGVSGQVFRRFFFPNQDYTKYHQTDDRQLFAHNAHYFFCRRKHRRYCQVHIQFWITFFIVNLTWKVFCFLKIIADNFFYWVLGSLRSSVFFTCVFPHCFTHCSTRVTPYEWKSYRGRRDWLVFVSSMISTNIKWSFVSWTNFK